MWIRMLEVICIWLLKICYEINSVDFISYLSYSCGSNDWNWFREELAIEHLQHYSSRNNTLFNKFVLNINIIVKYAFLLSESTRKEKASPRVQESHWVSLVRSIYFFYILIPIIKWTLTNFNLAKSSTRCNHVVIHSAGANGNQRFQLFLYK